MSRFDGKETRLRLLASLRYVTGISGLNWCRIPSQPRVTREGDAHVLFIDIPPSRFDET